MKRQLFLIVILTGFIFYGCHAQKKIPNVYSNMGLEYENVYLEVCFSACPRGLIEKLVEKAPLHKIIWGTDQIFMSAFKRVL